MFHESEDELPPFTSNDFARTYGNKPFVAKYQMGEFIRIYDREGTVDLLCSPEQDSDGYDALETLISQGPMGEKTYLWTKHVADDTIEVCLDILPKTDLDW